MLSNRWVAVGGCRFTDLDDPGNLQLDWLEVQLKTFRQRDMQVRLNLGHLWRRPTNLSPDRCGYQVFIFVASWSRYD